MLRRTSSSPPRVTLRRTSSFSLALSGAVSIKIGYSVHPYDDGSERMTDCIVQFTCHPIALFKQRKLFDLVGVLL